MPDVLVDALAGLISALTLLIVVLTTYFARAMRLPDLSQDDEHQFERFKVKNARLAGYMQKMVAEVVQQETKQLPPSGGDVS